MAYSGQETETGVAASAGARFVRGLGVAALVAGLAACSSAPDWAKPALIYGEDASEAAAAEPRTEKDFPELADVPNEPRPYSSESERAAIAEGLANDRARARYTDEVLRGGTEPPAPAPMTSKPEPVTSPVAPTSAAPSAPVAPQAAVIPAPSRNARPLPSAESAGEALVAATRAVETEPVKAATLPAPVQTKEEEKAAELAPTPAPAAPAPVAQAPVAQAQPAQRAAVPAVSGAPSTYMTRSSYSAAAQAAPQATAQAASSVQAAVPTDTPSLTATRSTRPAAAVTHHSRDTFEPSRAPAIAAEALEAAGGVVSSRYGQAALSGSADPVDPVEVNLDALGAAPAPRPEASLETLTLRRIVSNRDGLVHDDDRAVIANVESLVTQGAQGGPGDIPPYVVNFANGSTSLNVADRHMIAEAADIALDTGGVVRVVGHASGIASDDARARLANFGVSMDRATAVANELIRQGVAADRVIVEAKGANAPAYYETAPQGEAGNRRAEIYIE